MLDLIVELEFICKKWEDGQANIYLREEGSTAVVESSFDSNQLYRWKSVNFLETMGKDVSRLGRSSLVGWSRSLMGLGQYVRDDDCWSLKSLNGIGKFWIWARAHITFELKFELEFEFWKV